jgi:hypothetical protein
MVFKVFDYFSSTPEHHFNVTKSYKMQNTIGNKNGILYKYIMFGRGIWEKYQSRDEQFPKPNVEGNLVLIPLPNMIYLFNYTEYYLEHWLNK